MGDNRSSIRHATTAPAFEGDKAHRRRLVDELHRNLHRRLILIAAPAGYGKTTTLSDFSEHTELPVVWARLTPADQDATRLARLVWSGQTRRFRRLKSELDLDEHGGVTPEALAAMIAAAVRARVPEDFVLILDDVHKVNESDQATAFISELISNQPENMTAIVAGREVPRIPLVQLIAEDNLKSFGAEDLALDLEELQAILAKRLDAEVSEEQALALLEQSGGWVTAVLLSDLVTGARVPALGQNGDELTYEYLASNVFERQPEAVQEFLLQSAALPVMTVEACNVALESDDSEAMLAELQRRSLFVSVTRQQPKTYEYHDLFREFILARPEQEEAELRAIQRRAADYFAEREDAEQAFDLYIRAGEISAARAIAEEYASPMYEAGRDELLSRWKYILESHGVVGPQLLRLMARVVYLKGHQTQASEFVDSAWKLAQDEGDPFLEFMCTLTKIDFLTRRDDDSTWRELLAVAEQLAMGLGIPARFGLLVHEARYALYKKGERDEALKRVQRALELDLANVAPAMVTHALMTQSMLLCLCGDIDGSLASAKRANSIVEDRDSILRRPDSLNDIGYSYLLKGEYELAEGYLSQAQNLAKKTGGLNQLNICLVSIGELAADIGRSSYAVTCFQGALEIQETLKKDYWTSFVNMRLSMAFRRMGSLDMAVEIWSEFDRSRVVGIWTDLIALEVFAAEHWYSPSQFEAHAGPICQSSNLNARVQALTLLATSFLRAGNEERGLEYLRSALEAADESNLGQVVAGEANTYDVLESEINDLRYKYPGIVAEIQARIDGMQKLAARWIRPDHQYNSDQRSRKIQSLGQVSPAGPYGEVTATLKPIHREVFLYLIDRKTVSTQELAGVFWPAVSGKRAETSIHSAIHEIRRALGSRTILSRAGGYEVNPDFALEYDVGEFEQAARLALKIPAASPEAAPVCLEAVNSYTGQFLPGMDSDWILDRRSELNQLFVRVVERLVPLAENGKQNQELLHAIRRALDLEPYRERLNEAYVRELARAGRHAEARLHASRYRHSLAEDLQLSPSDEFEAAVERVLSSRLMQHPLRSLSV